MAVDDRQRLGIAGDACEEARAQIKHRPSPSFTRCRHRLRHGHASKKAVALLGNDTSVRIKMNMTLTRWVKR